MKRLQALRSLRWNYTRKGVWVWLLQQQRHRVVRDITFARISFYATSRGWMRVLREPEKVTAEQHLLAEGSPLAEGVFV